MAEHNYRVYVIGDDGYVLSRTDIVSVNDEAAQARAKQMVDGHDCELWDGARKIAAFEPEAIAQLATGKSYSERYNTMRSVSSDTPRTFRRKPVRTSIKLVANAARAALGLHGEEQAFELPARLFEQLPFAMYVCDREGLVLRYNGRAAELWGRSPKLRNPDERFCGSYRMFRPDGSLLPHDQCPMADVLRTGVSVRGQELHIERPDGSRGISLVDIEPVKDGGGNIVGAVNCFQDITERKRSEEVRLRLAAIIASSDDAIVSKDLDGTITSWNSGAERIFGYLAEEIIGKSIMTLIPPDHQKEEDTIINRIRRGERVEHYQTIRQRKDRSLIDISLTISPVRNAQGKIIGASKIARDITEHKRNEVQIINLAREAEHRTKNILSTVLATVRLSRADTSDDLKQLIEGRIDALAKVHGLFVQSRWTGAELHSLVTQEVSPYRGATEARVRIDGPPVMLEPNSAQTIAISLHELATNAAKYGSLSVAGGRVEIAWSRTADGRLSLRWIEFGGPTVTTPTRRGFGTRVIENIIVGQLKGEVRFDWRDQGLACEITLPLV
jgi:PAS domain S-box-containing protein